MSHQAHCSERAPYIRLTLRCRNGSGRPGKDFLKSFMSILLKIWPRCSGYSSATYARLLSWIDPEKKTFEVGGTPVSLDYAKFLGYHFRLDSQFFCFASIVLQY